MISAKRFSNFIYELTRECHRLRGSATKRVRALVSYFTGQTCWQRESHFSVDQPVLIHPSIGTGLKQSSYNQTFVRSF